MSVAGERRVRGSDSLEGTVVFSEVFSLNRSLYHLPSKINQHNWNRIQSNPSQTRTISWEQSMSACACGLCVWLEALHSVTWNVLAVSADDISRGASARTYERRRRSEERHVRTRFLEAFCSVLSLPPSAAISHLLVRLPAADS